MCSCVSVCVCVNKRKERKCGTQLPRRWPLFFYKEKSHISAQKRAGGPSASLFHIWVLFPFFKVLPVILKHRCKFVMVINVLHWPVWSSRSPWSRVSRSDRPGSGRCVSPGTGSYWGWSADAAPIHTKHLYFILARTLIDIMHSPAPDTTITTTRITSNLTLTLTCVLS